ncbi:MAG TPA: DUF4956 domain-containing protein [Bacteroidales bacterium]|nr:MAG: hypothetical protein BWX96_00189 [Bacteroidetes bacterium ADurb.Bin145]HOU01149.1 DUF4956 domain-containing protein [Bacteroidales bacterium]HQK68864.1 DUF4956 domain-containing protein [Bacteroidales bacterium]
MFKDFFDLSNPNFWEMFIRFIITVVFLFILIRLIYFRYSKKEKFVFTFFLMGIVVFFLAAAMDSAFVQMGMGFGLFAIFAILRFRTRNFSLKDMSYIFAVIGISVITSLKLGKIPGVAVVIFDSIICLTALILERFSIKYNSTTHRIVYENLDMLKSGKKQKLLKDVSELTGRDIIRVRIRKIDFKEKVALLDIYYKD